MKKKGDKTKKMRYRLFYYNNKQKTWEEDDENYKTFEEIGEVLNVTRQIAQNIKLKRSEKYNRMYKIEKIINNIEK